MSCFIASSKLDRKKICKCVRNWETVFICLVKLIHHIFERQDSLHFILTLERYSSSREALHAEAQLAVPYNWKAN